MFSRSCSTLLSRVALCTVLAAGCLRAQAPPPDQPFQAVHLLWIDTHQPKAEDSVRSAIAALNQAITQAGCPDCTYHLWKVLDATDGSYNYVQLSNWPNGAVYSKIHSSPEYLAASRNWEGIRSVVTREAYNRYVEVQLNKGTASKATLAQPPMGELGVAAGH